MRQLPPRATKDMQPALPFQQNAFGALAAKDSDDDSAETVVTQMAALAYQSQLTATTAANLSQQMGQYLQTLAHQQDQLHQNQHQMMEQWLLFCSTRVTLDEASDDKDAVRLHRRPRLPHTDLVTTHTMATADPRRSRSQPTRTS